MHDMIPPDRPMELPAKPVMPCLVNFGRQRKRGYARPPFMDIYLVGT